MQIAKLDNKFLHTSKDIAKFFFDKLMLRIIGKAALRGIVKYTYSFRTTTNIDIDGPRCTRTISYWVTISHLHSLNSSRLIGYRSFLFYILYAFNLQL